MTYWKGRLLRLWHDEGGFIQFLAPLASLVGGLFAGKKGKQQGNQAAGGARLQQLMPIIQQMMAQQQSRIGENYAAQQRQVSANQPLQDAVRQMALGLLPRRPPQ